MEDQSGSEFYETSIDRGRAFSAKYYELVDPRKLPQNLPEGHCIVLARVEDESYQAYFRLPPHREVEKTQEAPEHDIVVSLKSQSDWNELYYKGSTGKITGAREEEIEECLGNFLALEAEATELRAVHVSELCAQSFLMPSQVEKMEKAILEIRQHEGFQSGNTLTNLPQEIISSNDAPVVTIQVKNEEDWLSQGSVKIAKYFDDGDLEICFTVIRESQVSEFRLIKSGPDKNERWGLAYVYEAEHEEQVRITNTVINCLQPVNLITSHQKINTPHPKLQVPTALTGLEASESEVFPEESAQKLARSVAPLHDSMHPGDALMNIWTEDAENRVTLIRNKKDKDNGYIVLRKGEVEETIGYKLVHSKEDNSIRSLFCRLDQDKVVPVADFEAQVITDTIGESIKPEYMVSFTDWNTPDEKILQVLRDLGNTYDEESLLINPTNKQEYRRGFHRLATCYYQEWLYEQQTKISLGRVYNVKTRNSEYYATIIVEGREAKVTFIDSKEKNIKFTSDNFGTQYFNSWEQTTLVQELYRHLQDISTAK